VRRSFILLGLALAGGGTVSMCAPPLKPTGDTVPGLESFDRLMLDRLRAAGIPGGALAVGRNGRLIFARGYGLADVEAVQAVQPDSLFRIGSVSKVFTAAAILKLVEGGRLRLDDKAFGMLSELQPAPGAQKDARVGSITVAHLLNHAGGWDQRSTGLEPAMEPHASRAARAFGASGPPSAQLMIRYALGQPLDFDPGTKSVYSNLGFLVLGRLIEAISGQAYEQYVREKVLGPLEIRRMRLGRSLPDGRAPGEVRYYTESPAVPSVFPQLRGLVPLPYGGLYIEGIDSSGGWVASTIDLVRFVAALDGSRPPALLNAATAELMTQASQFESNRKWAERMGWAMIRERGGVGWMKMGSTGGDCTYLRRRADGLIVAASFNKPCAPGLDEEVARAVDQTVAWPRHDLFAASVGPSAREPSCKRP
jgi:CubicO group peptidase (beta-lactamase class C family)